VKVKDSLLGTLPIFRNQNITLTTIILHLIVYLYFAAYGKSRPLLTLYNDYKLLVDYFNLVSCIL
jgi:hypothetical protein